MRKIWDLAENTFRETIRDRVLNVSLLFALAMLGASVLLGTLSIGQDQKIVRDLGLAAIEFFGVAIAIFIGTSLLYRELDQRTVFIVLAKPVARHSFLLGKFCGLVATLTVLLALMTLAYVVLLLALRAFELPLLWAVALLWVELLLLVGLSLMFSTFASPVLALVYTFSLYLTGNNLDGLKALARNARPLVKVLAEGAYYLLPNLGHLNIKNQVVYGAPFSLGQWGLALAYGGCYTAFVLLLAVGIFARREF
ncbi:MAG: ABC transporter permease subunit [Cyanobacteria bacterium NC_groundwater_1444_Ag_S-0.65um_54_12]|nr:ABC transporter permease subunit [Cyanobacteria bacterium NC_groundwater_1444_Ag_S-0.65um_54_12]